MQLVEVARILVQLAARSFEVVCDEINLCLT